MKIIQLAFVITAILPASSFAATDCVTCHREKTPGAVRQWEASAHYKAGVGCEKCHGTDHEKIVKGEATVDLKTCGACHQKALREHIASCHAMGLYAVLGCIG